MGGGCGGPQIDMVCYLNTLWAYCRHEERIFRTGAKRPLLNTSPITTFTRTQRGGGGRRRGE